MGDIAAAPVKSVWGAISESADQFATESGVLAKGWHVFVILFLLCVLVLTVAWFIVVKATYITFVLTLAVASITVKIGTGG